MKLKQVLDQFDSASRWYGQGNLPLAKSAVSSLFDHIRFWERSLSKKDFWDWEVGTKHICNYMDDIFNKHKKVFGSLEFSSDGEYLVQLVTDDMQSDFPTTVALNGSAWPDSFEALRTSENMAFNPMTADIAVIGYDDNSRLVIENGIPWKTRGLKFIEKLQYTPQGNKLFALGEDANGWAVYANDKKVSGVITNPSRTRFSVDSFGEHYALFEQTSVAGQYQVSIDGKKKWNVVMTDAKEVYPCNQDGSFVCTAKTLDSNGKWRIYKDEVQIGGDYDDVLEIATNGTGTIAALVTMAGEKALIINGIISTYPLVHPEQLHFSPDGGFITVLERSATGAMLFRATKLDVSGERQPEVVKPFVMEGIVSQQCSYDGTHWCVVYREGEDGYSFLYIDGVRSKSFCGKFVTAPQFSSDGTKIMFVFQKGVDLNGTVELTPEYERVVIEVPSKEIDNK